MYNALSTSEKFACSPQAGQSVRTAFLLPSNLQMYAYLDQYNPCT